MTTAVYTVIEKTQVEVDVQLAGEKSIEKYALFVLKNSPFHRGPQTISELLNSGRNYLPARNVDTDEIHILNLEQIVNVRETHEPSPESGRGLVVTLTTGEEVTAVLYEVLPGGKDRTLDFMNGQRQMLPFLEHGTRIHINKKFVARVTEK